ncbi:hypothetical protein COP2_045329 [Malus domestica]
MLIAMKSSKVDSTAKMPPGHVLPYTATDSSFEKGKSAYTGSYERSTESEAGEFPEVYVLLKVNLLEDVDACARFVDSVGKIIIRSNSFVNCSAYSMKFFMIPTMHKNLILVAESMHIDQDVVKCVNEVKVALMAQLHSVVEKIEKLEFELAILNGFDVSAPYYM